jgi:hypothetical protein
MFGVSKSGSVDAVGVVHKSNEGTNMQLTYAIHGGVVQWE